MGQHLKTAGAYIGRSPYQALAAVLIMTLTFFVATILAVLAYASGSTLKYFETRPQVIAFLKEEATSEQISLLQRQLESDTRVKEVRYVSKEQALEIYREATSDNPLLSELVSPKIFPASLEFSVTELNFAEELIAEVRKQEVVDQVLFTASLGGSSDVGNVINNLRTITSYIRVGGSAILAFLLSSSFLIILVIISMRIASRREEIEVLKLIGATPSFIRAPFLLEGMFYGAVGAFTGWFVAGLLVLYALPTVASYFGEIPILPTQTSQLLVLFGVIFAGELALAVLLGVTGGFIALRRYLKL